MKRKKRPIILLEIVIALALITLFAAPLLREPMTMFRVRKEAMFSYLLGRDADNVRYEVLSSFYAGEIKDFDRHLELDKSEISLPFMSKELLIREVMLKKPPVKKAKQHEMVTLCTIYRKPGKKNALAEFNSKIHIKIRAIETI